MWLADGEWAINDHCENIKKKMKNQPRGMLEGENGDLFFAFQGDL
jgi:hypothetical protein